MSWMVEDIKRECEKLSAIVGDNYNCPIRINGRLTKTLGRVTIHKVNGLWYPEVLEISKSLLETSTDESILSVIAHEWCHYYVAKSTNENHGHDKVFKATCARVGCTNDGTSTKVDRTVAASALYKYQVYCPTCDEFIADYSRMNNTLKHLDQCTCKRCRKGGLTYIQNW